MPTLPEIGLHDEEGGNWLKDKGLHGWCLPAIALGTSSRALDYSHLAPDIRVIVRLSYGFAAPGGIGTFPDPDNQAETDGFIAAVLQTMALSRGVSGYVLGNEPNNSAEFPNFPNQKPITAKHYAEVYNRVWDDKPKDANLAPAAVDPYFGPPNLIKLHYEPDNLVWWKEMLNGEPGMHKGIKGADFFTIHCKTQDSNPDNIDSNATFTDPPLTGRFLHVRAYEPLLKAIPGHLRPRAVHATEVNPQRLTNPGPSGWDAAQGAEWVKKAVAHFRKWNANTNDLQVNSVIFYRFVGDEWKLHDKESILGAIRDEILAN